MAMTIARAQMDDRGVVVDRSDGTANRDGRGVVGEGTLIARLGAIITRLERPMVSTGNDTRADLTIQEERLGERRPLHEGDEARAGELLEGVVDVLITEPDLRRLPRRPVGIGHISVFDGHPVAGKIHLELVLPVVVDGAFNAKTGAAQFNSGDILISGDRRILVDAVIVHHQAATDLELELAVGAGELRRAFPFDLKVEIVAVAAFGSSGVRFGLAHLALQLSHLSLHGPHLSFERRCVRRLGCGAAESQKAKRARPDEQVNAIFLKSPDHDPFSYSVRLRVLLISSGSWENSLSPVEIRSAFPRLTLNVLFPGQGRACDSETTMGISWLTV